MTFASIKQKRKMCLHKKVWGSEEKNEAVPLHLFRGAFCKTVKQAWVATVQEKSKSTAALLGSHSPVI